MQAGQDIGGVLRVKAGQVGCGWGGCRGHPDSRGRGWPERVFTVQAMLAAASSLAPRWPTRAWLVVMISMVPSSWTQAGAAKAIKLCSSCRCEGAGSSRNIL